MRLQHVAHDRGNVIFVLGVGLPKRMPEDRMFAFESFKQLMLKLFVLKSGAHFMLPKAGARGDSLVSIDPSGFLDTADVISRRLLPKVSEVWNLCKHANSFPYIVSPVERVTVWELVGFTHDPNLSDQDALLPLRPLGLRLYDLCCAALDSNVEEFCRGDLKKKLKEELEHKSANAARQAHFLVSVKSGQAMWNATSNAVDEAWPVMISRSGMYCARVCI